ncbi:MAG: YiiX/YebB-like N1pC/P60 family cysteine hydrolase [Opitutales bacterium]|nr:YiiX/YebB-like N1pC/P60 family cysteine hydrolase [Opitutales bacterium]
MASVEKDQLSALLEADSQHLAFIDQKMQAALSEIQESPLFEAAQISTTEAEQLEAVWARFLEASFELDMLKNRHRTFYQVNGFSHPKLHAQSFLIAYAAHLGQYRAAAMATAKIGKQETAKKLLDDAHPQLGIPSGSFARIQLMVTRPDEIIRLNAGRAYLKLMQNRLAADDPTVIRAKEQIKDIDHLVKKDVGVFVKNPLDVLEHKASKAWFPVQKGVALGIAAVRTTKRENFITQNHLEAESDKLLPGDIFLTRREWHLTNLGIPGYWTHAALHIGSLEQMDLYFADLSEMNGQTPSAIIQERFPKVYAELTQSDSSGIFPSVMEALGPGVVLQTLAASATADSLAVLRPQVSKADRWDALLSALPHFGRPYNYQFDFRIDTALVCSQLIHKAYETIDSIELEPKMNGGRLLLSPNEIAIKFDQEHDQVDAELKLVTFLDGTDIGKVPIRSAEQFRTSWSRPKWHIVFKSE